MEITKLNQLQGEIKEYKKKPIVIKAVQLQEKEISIKTREGVLKGYKGDFIIKGIQGEIYPCGEKIFYKTYMPLYVNADDKETQRKFEIYPVVD